MDFKNKTITVLYGSQTGNSQDVAERIWRESKRFFFTGSVKAMNDYNISGLVNESCVIFVCSTTGQGEEPDNMQFFWKLLLRKSLSSNLLSNLKFAVLGLGDSSYVKFNFTAKRLNKRLMQLGAQMLIPVGLGDEQHDLGYDAAVDPWIDSLWNKLVVIYPLPDGICPLDVNGIIKPRWKITSNIINNFANNLQHRRSMYYSVRTAGEFNVTVKDIIRTTDPLHFQDVRLIKLQTNGERYLPGDVVVVRPKNSPEQVKEFQQILISNGIDIPGNTVFKISETDSEMPVPGVLQFEVTFQQLCEEYFDLNAIPRRHTFSVLAQLTDSELEEEKCLEFTTAEGQNDLYNYCNRPHRNIVEVLQDFPHATKNISKNMLFELIPPIKPREFSIASSWQLHEKEIHILLAVVHYKTKLVKERLGLCSNYLANLKIGDKISVWLKRGSFEFPKNKDAPIIMVGPGTGMAPFRNFIFEREREGTADSRKLIFFFGCRGQNSDFHCKEDFIQLHSQQKLNLLCAFSRDQENKVYVQHKIVEHGDTVWEALKNKDAYIFVAGNSKNMPQQVREAFIDVCVSKGGMLKEEALKFLDNMERRGQYQTETWS